MNLLRNLVRFYLVVSGVNQGNKEGRKSNIFLCYRRGSGASPQSFRDRGSVMECVWRMCR